MQVKTENVAKNNRKEKKVFMVRVVLSRVLDATLSKAVMTGTLIWGLVTARELN